MYISNCLGLQVSRRGGYREREPLGIVSGSLSVSLRREERLEALMELRAHALRLQNCHALWADEEVRSSVLDAVQAPDPERGKSLYVEEAPEANALSIRTAAFGILAGASSDLI